MSGVVLALRPFSYIGLLCGGPVPPAQLVTDMEKCVLDLHDVLYPNACSIGLQKRGASLFLEVVCYGEIKLVQAVSYR